jgi:alpha-glucoside transport system permease protein
VSSTPSSPAVGTDQRPPPTGKQPDRGPTRRGMDAILSIALFVAALLVLVYSFIWMRDTDAGRGLVVAVAIVVGVGGVWAIYYAMDRLVDTLSIARQETVRPWVFVGPAIVLLGIFLVYPAVYTTMISFQDARGVEWIGWDNYAFVFSDPSMLRAIRNSLAWSVVVPLAATGIGLIFAVLADRLTRLESVAKSLIFLPMAISFVGASVVWGFVYDFRVFGNQTGLLNGIMVALGADPVSWLSWQPWNNLFLMVIMIWMQTGFAMVILSAAIKSVPSDLLEAGRIDGATEFQIFRRITIPTIMSSIVVVLTTVVINTLKVFDIVWVLTNGDSGTEVVAERMVRWFFRFNHQGIGASIAVLMFVAIVPIMFMNIRRFRAEEETR